MKIMPYLYGALAGAAIVGIIWYMVYQTEKAKENKQVEPNADPAPVTPPTGTQTPPATTTGETAPATGSRGFY